MSGSTGRVELWFERTSGWVEGRLRMAGRIKWTGGRECSDGREDQVDGWKGGSGVGEDRVSGEVR